MTKKPAFYAVANGRRIDVFRTWDECRAQVEGFPAASDPSKWEAAPVVYTDGACSNNGKLGAKAGYGVYWGPDHEDNACGPVTGAPTNNRGELLAVDVALKQVKFEHVPGHSGVPGNEAADSLARQGAQMFSSGSNQ
ncbi:unnamed protein product [Nippostrongylus brasiliensis]|uniref:ribonuclease H n=1 Tax=Nippostrongylus brasiliensis TaxID=27835 RepID=A0A0N4XUI5_NIPBR|nr:unnamed protein product [Nippostrongylus brasiliensis]